MKKLLLFFITFLKLCHTFRKEGEGPDIVSSDNFDRVVKTNKFALVLYYAPWKETCEPLLKLMDQLAEQYKRRSDIVIAKADVYNDGKLASRFQIEDYCELRYFIRGSDVAERYEGRLKLEDIIAFVTSKSDFELDKAIFHRPLIHLDNSNFDRIVKNKNKDVLVYFYAKWCIKCTNLTKVMMKVANTFKNEPDCVLAMIDGEKSFETAVRNKVGVYPTFMFYSRKNKDGDVYLPGKFDENWSQFNLTKFLNMRCDTKRTAEGVLDQSAGRFDELDNLAGYFMRNARNRERTLKEAVEKVHKLPAVRRRQADYYIKVMEKIIKDGIHFLDDEISRLQKLIIGEVSLDKKDEFAKRRNILKQFRRNLRDEL